MCGHSVWPRAWPATCLANGKGASHRRLRLVVLQIRKLPHPRLSSRSRGPFSNFAVIVILKVDVLLLFLVSFVLSQCTCVTDDRHTDRQQKVIILIFVNRRMIT